MSTIRALEYSKGLPVLLNAFDLGHLSDQVTHLVAIEFGNNRNAVNVADQIGLDTEECLECALAFDPCEKATVGRDSKFLYLRPSACSNLRRASSRESQRTSR